MAEVLTQQQIDQLLGNIQSGELDIQEMEEQSETKKIKDYDFRSPKKIKKEQLKYLYNIYDNFARFFGLQMTTLLRASCELEILEVEEEEYREFNNALEDSVLACIANIKSEDFQIEDGKVMIELSRPISYSIMDLLLGGDGSGYNIERGYTEIEISIMEYLFRIMIKNLTNAWSNYSNIEHSFGLIETNSRVIQFCQPDETIAIVVMKITLNDLTGNMNICIPSSILKSICCVFDNMSGKNSKKDIKNNEDNGTIIMDAIKQTSLQVSGILGSTEIELGDLLSLSKGDVIVLDNEKDMLAKVMIDDEEWFSSKVGIYKNKYALKIADKK